ncbi:MAG: hypothetical protein DRO05_04190 [Thermoproteota archaeon]|nr:MAG: hypothetical protein DRO05_04190 [Candidatus Korarchaeota archaeon]
MVSREVIERIESIRLDERSGARELSKKALLVLKFTLKTTEEETFQGILREFNEVGRLLLQARPNMAPVRNLVAKAIYEVNILRKGRKGWDSLILKELAISRIDKLIKSSELSLRKVSIHGASLVMDFDVIATCSYSSTLCEVFKVAKKEGKRFRVLVSESRSRGKAYGLFMAEKLDSYGIQVEVFPDYAIDEHLREAKKVFVGADSILPDGSLINGTPTYQLAQTSRGLNLPFFSICETSKFEVRHRGELGIGEGFDLVPSDLITAIVTEIGVIEPSKVPLIAKQMEEYVRFVEILFSPKNLGAIGDLEGKSKGRAE